MNSLNEILEFTFYTDPGHGWLEVPMEYIDRFGVREEISGYSYIHNGRAYLEEDSDVAVFLDELDRVGQAWKTKHIHKEYTPIRGYRSFCERAA